MIGLNCSWFKPWIYALTLNLNSVGVSNPCLVRESTVPVLPYASPATSLPNLVPWMLWTSFHLSLLVFPSTTESLSVLFFYFPNILLPTFAYTILPLAWDLTLLLVSLAALDICRWVMIVDSSSNSVTFLCDT